MLKSDLCDFSDAYIVVKRTITVAKKIFTADDFEAPNNTESNANATNTGNDNALVNANVTNTANDNALGEKKLVFKNNAPFINCISKIISVKIDNAEHLDVVMPMYNLIEYSKTYRETKCSLWNYYRDERNQDTDDN